MSGKVIENTWKQESGGPLMKRWRRHTIDAVYITSVVIHVYSRTNEVASLLKWLMFFSPL